MKNIKGKAAFLLLAVFFITGVPFLTSPDSTGGLLPLAFTGAIFGCGGEKEPVQQADLNKTAVAAENKTVVSDNKETLKVTFVELGSASCMPCKMMQPVMEKVEKRYPGQVKVVYYDVMTESGRSEGYRYAIRVIPTQVFLDNNGKEYFRHEGFFSFEDVDKILKQKGVE